MRESLDGEKASPTLMAIFCHVLDEHSGSNSATMLRNIAFMMNLSFFLSFLSVRLVEDKPSGSRRSYRRPPAESRTVRSRGRRRTANEKGLYLISP